MVVFSRHRRVSHPCINVVPSTSIYLHNLPTMSTTIPPDVAVFSRKRHTLRQLPSRLIISRQYRAASPGIGFIALEIYSMFTLIKNVQPTGGEEHDAVKDEQTRMFLEENSNVECLQRK